MHVRVWIRDADRRVRMSRTMSMYAAECVGVIASDVPLERHGVFAQGGSEYELLDWEQSNLPGIHDVALTRISGPGINEWDLSRAALAGPRGETVVVDGVPMRAHVRRQQAVIEEDAYGSDREVLRNIVAIPEPEAAGVVQGSVVAISGTEHQVQYTLRDGLGMVKVIC